MEIVNINGATRILGKPSDWDESKGLPIIDHPEGWMISEWRPTPLELQALVEGGSVRLWVQGDAHPVVSLEGVDATGAQIIDPTANLEERLRWLRQTLKSLNETLNKQASVCQLALDATK